MVLTIEVLKVFGMVHNVKIDINQDKRLEGTRDFLKRYIMDKKRVYN